MDRTHDSIDRRADQQSTGDAELTSTFELAPAAPLPGGDGVLPPAARSPGLARIGLRRTGVSLATVEALRLAEAHALARDAVHARLSTPALLAELRELGLPALAVHSAVPDRREYLLRPDLGRALSADSGALLRLRRRSDPGHLAPPLLAILIGDGLSALAADRHAIGVLKELLPRLGVDQPSESSSVSANWQLGPIVVAEQARVGLGDAVADVLAADAVVVLLGERPGMSSPDSLGAYVTWRPHPGVTDAERNCVSNIRAEGLGYPQAAQAIAWYLDEGRRTGATGVTLRAFDRPAELASGSGPTPNRAEG